MSPHCNPWFAEWDADGIAQVTAVTEQRQPASLGVGRNQLGMRHSGYGCGFGCCWLPFVTLALRNNAIGQARSGTCPAEQVSVGKLTPWNARRLLGLFLAGGSGTTLQKLIIESSSNSYKPLKIHPPLSSFSGLCPKWFFRISIKINSQHNGNRIKKYITSFFLMTKVFLRWGCHDGWVGKLISILISNFNGVGHPLHFLRHYTESCYL